MDYVHIIIKAIVSIVVLFFLTKLMGKKQISQLSLFDYIIGISIGSIAAQMSTDIDLNFFHPLVAMLIYAGSAILISYVTEKSQSARRFLDGKATVLIEKGQLYKENFKKSRLTVNEFLAECRNQGYFDINDVESAVIETNGKISILPKRDARPVTPKDMNLTPEQDGLVANVVIDGVLVEKNLQAVGKNQQWLKNRLEAKGYPNIKDILLATIDHTHALRIYPYASNPAPDTFFE